MIGIHTTRNGFNLVNSDISKCDESRFRHRLLEPILFEGCKLNLCQRNGDSQRQKLISGRYRQG